MPFPVAIIPLIAAGIAAAGSIISGRQQRKAVESSNQANRELAQYQYSKDLEMWNRQNEYNSPLAQMNRYSQAGLNPNLIYGQGNSGNAGSMPRYQAPTMQPVMTPSIDIPQVLSAYQDFRMKQAQIDNVKAQTENTNAKTASESIRPTLLKIAEATGNQKLRESLTSYESRMQQYANVAESGELKIHQQIKALGLMDTQQQLKSLEVLRSQKSLETMSLQQEAIAADNLFKKYRNEWMKEGITSGDNLMLRVLVRMLGESGLQGVLEKAKGAANERKEYIKNRFAPIEKDTASQLYGLPKGSGHGYEY